MTTTRNVQIADLHPIWREEVHAFLAEVANMTDHFMLFEGYRSPQRQDELYNERPKVTHAYRWQSAHQYGLAIDVVPYPWSWSDQHDWEGMRQLAMRKYGFLCPLVWDKPHIEHAQFHRGIRAAWK